MEALAGDLFSGVRMTLEFLWDSLYGLIFGFLISAVAQVAFSRRALERALGPNLRGILTGAAFGIIASACSYGAAAAARGLFRKGADLRAVFAFLISSTNMNVAILIMFWALLGWRFAFAEFFGGIIIIAVVSAGIGLLFRPGELAALAASARLYGSEPSDGCPQCGMTGDPQRAIAYQGKTYLFCSAHHEDAFRADPAAVLNEADAGEEPGAADLRKSATWRGVLEVALGDVAMLRNDLVIGFVVAGFAAALVPSAWLSGALHAVGAVPILGYPLLLLTGLGLAIITFVCSMGNVPIARYLALAGIPLGANTTFIYGDLLVPPLIGIYRKSFPPKVVWAFLGSFVAGALLAGALMDALIGGPLGGATMESMTALSDRFTLVANVLAVGAALAVTVIARRGGRAQTLREGRVAAP